MEFVGLDGHYRTSSTRVYSTHFPRMVSNRQAGIGTGQPGLLPNMARSGNRSANFKCHRYTSPTMAAGVPGLCGGSVSVGISEFVASIAVTPPPPRFRNFHPRTLGFFHCGQLSLCGGAEEESSNAVTNTESPVQTGSFRLNKGKNSGLGFTPVMRPCCMSTYTQSNIIVRSW